MLSKPVFRTFHNCITCTTKTHCINMKKNIIDNHFIKNSINLHKKNYNFQNTSNTNQTQTQTQTQTPTFNSSDDQKHL